MATVVFASEDVQLAEDLIAQNDCENALTILIEAWKNKIGLERKKILLSINYCAEQVQNYKRKETSEMLILKMDPLDVTIQIKYLESLFCLSKYKNALAYSNTNKGLITFFDYWIIRARSFFEINRCDKAIPELNNLLNDPKMTRKAKIYYWLGQCYAAQEDLKYFHSFRKKIAELVLFFAYKMLTIQIFFARTNEFPTPHRWLMYT